MPYDTSIQDTAILNETRAAPGPAVASVRERAYTLTTHRTGTSDERRAWDETLLAHGGHLLQSWRWGELKARHGWRVERVSVAGPWGLGRAQVLFKHRGPLSLAYVPRGPLLVGDADRGLGELVEAIDERCKRHRAISLIVEPNGRLRVSGTYRQAGFVRGPEPFQPSRTVKVPLLPDDELMAQMHGKHRYNIRLAGKRGVEVTEAGVGDMPAFYALLQDTAERNRFGVHTPEYYADALRLFGDDATMLFARIGGDVAAAAIAARFGDEAVYLYGASSSTVRADGAAFLLQYEAMRWARDRGAKRYDLWGIPARDPEPLPEDAVGMTRSQGEDQRGLLTFKTRFGGDIVGYPATMERRYSRLLSIAARRLGCSVADPAIARRTVSELAGTVAGATVLGDGATLVLEIAYDSRDVEPGQLFVALRGADFDGHRYVEAAVARGASAVLIDQRAVTGGLEPTVPAIAVDDTRAALAPMSAEFFGHPSRSLAAIGITGTDGKTTTSYLLDHILTSAGIATGMIGTVALRINGVEDRHSLRQTTPESVEVQRLLRRMVDAGCRVAILEATSHGLDLHRLDGVRFAIGGVTNITHEHLEHHKTIAAYRRAKAKLFENVAAHGGDAVINLDDEGAREMLPFAEGSGRVIRYSREGRPAATLLASAIESDASGSRFTVHATDEDVETTACLPLLGGFNVENALCALGIARLAGVGYRTAIAALATAPSPPGRLAKVDAGQPFSVVVDYAHTPESLAKVLELLRGLNRGGRLIVVFGSAGERDTTKRPIQGRVAAERADYVVVTSEDPRNEDPETIIAEIAAGAISAGAVSGVDLATITDRRDAIRHAVEVARPGDCILLAGKGHEGSIIWGFEKRPWDEEAVAREALADAGYVVARP